MITRSLMHCQRPFRLTLVWMVALSCSTGISEQPVSAQPATTNPDDVEPKITEQITRRLLAIRPEWVVRDSHTAIEIAGHVLGVQLGSDKTNAVLTGIADEALICDDTVSNDNPAWKVSTQPVRFILHEEEGYPPIKTAELPFDVLVRAKDGAVLRARTPALTIDKPKATVESLAATAFLRRMECGEVIHHMVVHPKSNLEDVLASIYMGCGGPEGAQQIIVHLWNWSSPDCAWKAPRDVWCVELRSAAGGASLTGGMEQRFPADKRPLASVMVHYVNDGSNIWLKGSNFPKPRVVADDGTVLDPGDSLPAPSAKSDIPAEKTQAEKKKEGTK